MCSGDLARCRSLIRLVRLKIGLRENLGLREIGGRPKARMIDYLSPEVPDHEWLFLELL